MKANDFLKLVGRMLTAQQNYFKSRLQGDLVQAKQLEKDVAAVVKIGKLEPDEPKPVYTNTDMFSGANFCLWSRDVEMGCWDTSCKQTFITETEMDEGSLEENNYRFCPNCGKQIHEHTLITGA